MHPSFKCLIPLLLFVAAMPAMVASAPLAGAGRPPLAFTAGGETRLELASGERLTLPLPAGAEVAATAALGDGWLAAGTAPGAAGGREIVLLTGRAGGHGAVAALPPPAGREGRLRREPLPLVADGRLAGLVWLEGDSARRLAVRFARWDGAGWEAPRTVSPAGPGSQLALTAARLADGTWLLAWSAFDGHDDEIVWSRLGSDGAWSRPRRVAADNDVPDITPVLAADAEGAFLAWSRFDGSGYRVVLARFRAGRWEAPREVGPAGSLYPSFENGAAWLLFATAVPHGWSVLQLDGDGRPGRTASVTTAPSARNERPVVAPGAGGVTFRFPAAAVEKTAPWAAADERQP